MVAGQLTGGLLGILELKGFKIQNIWDDTEQVCSGTKGSIWLI